MFDTHQNAKTLTGNLMTRQAIFVQENALSEMQRIKIIN